MQNWDYISQHTLLSSNITGIMIFVILVKMVMVALIKSGLTMMSFSFLLSRPVVAFFFFFFAVSTQLTMHLNICLKYCCHC